AAGSTLSVQQPGAPGPAGPDVRVLQEPRAGIGDRPGRSVYPREPRAPARRLRVLHQGPDAVRAQPELPRALVQRRPDRAPADRRAQIVPGVSDDPRALSE